MREKRKKHTMMVVFHDEVCEWSYSETEWKVDLQAWWIVSVTPCLGFYVCVIYGKCMHVYLIRDFVQTR